MARVTKTELNQQTARVLARVAAGERLVVTDRGRPIAEISPPRESRWDELVASGQIVPASTRGPLAHPPTRDDESSVVETLDVLRGDRG